MQAITPLYNHYKQHQQSISGVEALKIMWKIGDILKKHIEANNIAPHALFWKIYGKSEGAENIAQKSWITREFQGRCYRIRNIFSSLSQIEKVLPHLRRFSSFRQAMPFFDNKKYLLKGREKEKMLALLNSETEECCIKKEISKLQARYINIKNPRTQRLGDFSAEKEIFINFYNAVYRLLNEPLEKVSLTLKENCISPQYITVLAKNTNALSQDGLQFTDFPKENAKESIWEKYGAVLKDFSSHRNAIKVRRFRRIVSAERIVRLADMLYAIPSATKK